MNILSPARNRFNKSLWQQKTLSMSSQIGIHPTRDSITFIESDSKKNKKVDEIQQNTAKKKNVSTILIQTKQRVPSFLMNKQKRKDKFEEDRSTNFTSAIGKLTKKMKSSAVQQKRQHNHHISNLSCSINLNQNQLKKLQKANKKLKKSAITSLSPKKTKRQSLTKLRGKSKLKNPQAQSSWYLPLESCRSYRVQLWSLDKFQIGEKIGKGSYGDVVTVRQKSTGNFYALKKIKKSMLVDLKHWQNLIRQIKIQSYLNHPHLLSLFNVFSDNQYIYLVLELMQESLFKLIQRKKKLSQLQTAYFAKQLCEGLKHMHDNQVMHRDLKAQNVFISYNFLKIGDFGCAVYSKDLRQTQIGSFAYISPEQLLEEKYSQKIDSWCLGTLTYEMLFGKLPFLQSLANNQKQNWQINFPNQISQNARDFLIKLLQKDHLKRVSIKDILNHPYLNLQNF